MEHLAGPGVIIMYAALRDGLRRGMLAAWADGRARLMLATAAQDIMFVDSKHYDFYSWQALEHHARMLSDQFLGAPPLLTHALHMAVCLQQKSEQAQLVPKLCQ